MNLKLILAGLLVAAAPLGAAAAMQLHSPVIVDEGSQTTVAPGETFFISLYTNPTTGYGWSTKVSDPAIVTYQGASMLPDPLSSGGVRRVGAGEHQLFVFHANRTGTTTIVFSYARDWEKDRPPANTSTFTITVK